jgi:hypothetical protein
MQYVKSKLERVIDTMANITEVENKFLNELTKDCIMFRLTETEALEYIEHRFRPISLSSYKSRKSKINSDKSTEIWLNHFTRVGFVTNHKNHIEYIKSILDDSLRQFFIEKNKKNRDEKKLQNLKNDIRENTKLLSELNLGTPVISAIKSRIENNEKGISVST